MLIGIAGPAGSGKDTVAEFINKHSTGVSIAQADPMKRFAADVFGFTEHQLWGPSDARNGADDRFLNYEAWQQALARFTDEAPCFLRGMGLEDTWMSQLCAWFNWLMGAYFPVPQDGWPPLGSTGLALANERGRFLVDSDDVERVRQYSWHIKSEERKNTDYAKATIEGAEVALHRFILDVVDPNVHIDHVNGDGLDNRHCNLRICNNQENHFNTNAKGYTWDKHREKWSAKIAVNGQTINLGRFDSEDEAHAAYVGARKLHFGEFGTKKGLTPRLVLQTLGTEFGRVARPSMWNDYALRTANILLEGGVGYSRTRGLEAGGIQNPEFVVVTDVRFRNEVLGIKREGGIVINVTSPSADNSAIEAAGVKGHRSEAELKGIPKHWFDHVLINDKSNGLQALENCVHTLVNSFKSRGQTWSTKKPDDDGYYEAYEVVR
jgi:hypothetical protein